MAESRMKAIPKVDLAILGGGCAGLSLAKHLSQKKQWAKKTLIIETRKAYTNDRSWCFWEPQKEDLRHYLDPLITHKWSKWQFSGAHFSLLHNVLGRDYCFIPSDVFYKDALEYIDKHPQMQLCQGLEALSVTPKQDGYLIELSDSTHIFSHQIIDTRPKPYTDNTQSKLWQVFYGLEIKTPTAIFDDNQIGLMADLQASQKGTEFIYLLPFSKQHALIEWTQFSPKLISPDALASKLNLYLQSYKTDFEIIRKEQAILPMGLKMIKNTMPNVAFGGQVAGAIRPATGYAFLRIQKWARDCANQLALGRKIQEKTPTQWLTHGMDMLFLDVLHQNPEMGANLFQALAQKVSPDALVRFLSDEARVPDYIQVIRALPAKLFLKQWLRPKKVILNWKK